MRSSFTLRAFASLDKKDRAPLVPFPSPSESLPALPGSIYPTHCRVWVALPVAPWREFQSDRAPLLGFLFPSAYAESGVRISRVYLTRHIPLSRFGYLLSGLLLPTPPRFFSPWNAHGICPSELSLPEEPYASRRPSPHAVTPASPSMANDASAIRFRDESNCRNAATGYCSLPESVHRSVVV